jgi:hypothetical protein
MARPALRPFQITTAAVILIWQVRGPDAASCAGSRRKAWAMKHIVGKTLAAIGCLGVIAALVAGKDDIRKFRRMRDM